MAPRKVAFVSKKPRLSLSLDQLKTLSAEEAAVPRGRDCLPIASGSNKGGGGDGLVAG